MNNYTFVPFYFPYIRNVFSFAALLGHVTTSCEANSGFTVGVRMDGRYWLSSSAQTRGVTAA